MKRSLLIVLLAVGLVATACSDDDGGSNPTMGDACSQIGSAFCDKLAECQAAPEDCTNTFIQGCCKDDGTCEKAADVSQSQIDSCGKGVDGLSCDQATQGQLPSACQ